MTQNSKEENFREVSGDSEGSPGGSVEENLPVMPETLRWEDTLEKGMATHSILAWRIP